MQQFRRIQYLALHFDVNGQLASAEVVVELEQQTGPDTPSEISYISKRLQGEPLREHMAGLTTAVLNRLKTELSEVQIP